MDRFDLAVHTSRQLFFLSKDGNATYETIARSD